MKSINEIVNESSVINEAFAKDVHKPRKGSDLYIMKRGETKLHKVKVADVIVTPMYRTDKSSKSINIVFADNDLNFKGYYVNHFSSIDYSNPDLCTHIVTDDGEYYIGISKDAIKQFISNRNLPRIQSLSKKINELNDELKEFEMEKAKLENEINSEISESLK